MLAAAATAAPLPPRAWRTVVAQVREVLESETHVDMDKLLSLCQHGLPAALRGEAWMYLLEDAEERQKVELHPDVEPAGDWRAYDAVDAQARALGCPPLAPLFGTGDHPAPN